MIAITRVADGVVLKRLDTAAKVQLAKDLPWPYSGMVSDITSAIETGCNYSLHWGFLAIRRSVAESYCLVMTTKRRIGNVLTSSSAIWGRVTYLIN